MKEKGRSGRKVKTFGVLTAERMDSGTGTWTRFQERIRGNANLNVNGPLAERVKALIAEDYRCTIGLFPERMAATFSGLPEVG